MSNRIHALAQRLTGKQNLEDCSLDEVKHIAQRYPYFAPAQFLLLQKLRQSGKPEEAEAQYQKAVLFYPDPLQFELFISSGYFYDEDTETNEVEGHSPEILEEERKENITENDVQQTLTGTKELQSSPINEETNPASALQPPAFIEQVNPVNSKEEATEHSPVNIAPEEPQEIIISEVIVTKGLEETTAVQPEKIEPSEPAQTTAALTFEPYHTVDYFASQGIKISQDELPKDKLGKQLKSFTEWLKTMKRLPAAQLDENTENAAEKGVETLASRSVTDSEVLTEAMAEVWAKQGIPEKALDIYNKLLLHNPSKKAYFAAKIDNLKQF
ncbi:hypothetical protein [Flavisolibacter ginsenosidimutans]|uniref:Tetratricopeptide repeat protein n=1 Tax=Flavisolibacter ginsenosidimutans TaxID=661481 RepID=A0A5B8UEW6_9BACT|nr:hypothetical protein [Flavisolibacter ginsenosidimutans]QEC54905.1 hypothetical protein FSB75_02975 [Flavisolibacter ginsenosidimutans]